MPDGDRMIEELTARRSRAYEAFVADVGAAQGRLDREVNEIEEALARLSGTADPEVLVRTSPGTSPSVYHRADRPCGRVTGRNRRARSFQRLRLSEARASGLLRCTACRWDAP